MSADLGAPKTPEYFCRGAMVDRPPRSTPAKEQLGLQPSPTTLNSVTDIIRLFPKLLQVRSMGQLIRNPNASLSLSC